MSRAPTSRSERSGNSKIAGSSPELVALKPGQTNDFIIDTCCFLAWRSALLGSGKDWLAQCQDNVTEWCPVREHYKTAMSAHCHKSVPMLI